MEEKILINARVNNESETRDFAIKSLKYFKSGDTILLYGDLGSGKTYLTKLYCNLLEVDYDITSPSFSIINQYQGSVSINHLDFYRVQNNKELLNLGLDDILNMDSINYIEWPQIIEQHIIWDHYRIYIDFVDDNPFGRNFKLINMSN